MIKNYTYLILTGLILNLDYDFRVDEASNVLIADFGLARDIYEQDYYRIEDKQRPLPVKWMALESLEESVFSNKTDVVC